MGMTRRFIFCCAAVILLSLTEVANAAIDHRGIQFLAFTNISDWNKSSGEQNGKVFTKEIPPEIKWDELILSWDAPLASNSWIKVEARADHDGKWTKFFGLGEWSGDPSFKPRTNQGRQRDNDGYVSTDTLTLNKPAGKVQLRLTASSGADSAIKFVGVCLTDTSTSAEALAPNKEAWDKTIPVPERSQMAYPNGGVLCSPTTVSMIMTYWAKKLNRVELDHDVPDVAAAVYDKNWHGTGNWTFNMAYAGSYPGMRGYVSRMSDVSELEDWIARGLPVGISVCYDRLRGKGKGPNGHLIVCVGFTKDGDVIVNDPGTAKNVRKTFPRKNLIYAWANSRNAVYLIYPEGAELPKDRFGHWSATE
jgi:hypothetical protein